MEIPYTIEERPDTGLINSKKITKNEHIEYDKSW